MSRRARTLVLALGVVAFLALSAGLARFLSTENAERDAILTVLSAQARGDLPGVLSHLDGCAARPPCAADARAGTQHLRRGADVKILRLDSRTAYALSDETAKTRVAWTVLGRPPVVQCVLVRRKGNAISGLSITLMALSPPISSTGDC